MTLQTTSGACDKPCENLDVSSLTTNKLNKNTSVNFKEIEKQKQ